MGSSGAGKTTLLNVISGRVANFKGELFANKHPYTFETFGTFANYVMQQDLLMQTLTVRETLMFAASLKYTNLEKI
jgi:ABC-type multidrug transport system ATPase subunit